MITEDYVEEKGHTVLICKNKKAYFFVLSVGQRPITLNAPVNDCVFSVTVGPLNSQTQSCFPLRPECGLWLCHTRWPAF